MSVTITIAGNEGYCDANGLTGETVYECQCGGAWAECFDCKGSGKVRFARYPFEANLANGNAYAVIEILKLPTDDPYCGQCDPQAVLDGIEFVRTLQAIGCQPLVTEAEESHGESGARIISCGRDRDHVEHYLTVLQEIAMEAARRKAVVVWG